MDLNSRSPVGSDLAGIVSVLTSVADLNSRSPVGSDSNILIFLIIIHNILYFYILLLPFSFQIIRFSSYVYIFLVRIPCLFLFT